MDNSEIPITFSEIPPDRQSSGLSFFSKKGGRKNSGNSNSFLSSPKHSQGNSQETMFTRKSFTQTRLEDWLTKATPSSSEDTDNLPPWASQRSMTRLQSTDTLTRDDDDNESLASITGFLLEAGMERKKSSEELSYSIAAVMNNEEDKIHTTAFSPGELFFNDTDDHYSTDSALYRPHPDPEYTSIGVMSVHENPFDMAPFHDETGLPDAAPYKSGDEVSLPDTAPYKSDSLPDTMPYRSEIDDVSLPDTIPCKSDNDDASLPDTMPYKSDNDDASLPDTMPYKNDVDDASLPDTIPYKSDVDDENLSYTIPYKSDVEESILDSITAESNQAITNEQPESQHSFDLRSRESQSLAAIEEELSYFDGFTDEEVLQMEKSSSSLSILAPTTSAKDKRKAVSPLLVPVESPLTRSEKKLLKGSSIKKTTSIDEYFLHNSSLSNMDREDEIGKSSETPAYTNSSNEGVKKPNSSTQDRRRRPRLGIRKPKPKPV